MEFRKVLFGGYDKKEVQMALEMLKKEYEAKMLSMKKEFEEKTESMQKEFDTKFEELQADYEKMQKDLSEDIHSLTSENEALILKQGRMKVAYKEYCENTLQQYANSLRALSNEFSQVLDNVVNLQKEIGSKDILGEMDRALEMKQMYDMLEDVENVEE